MALARILVPLAQSKRNNLEKEKNADLSNKVGVFCCKRNSSLGGETPKEPPFYAILEIAFVAVVVLAEKVFKGGESLVNLFGQAKPYFFDEPQKEPVELQKTQYFHHKLFHNSTLLFVPFSKKRGFPYRNCGQGSIKNDLGVLLRPSRK